jgi:hypothetical protein
MLSKQTLDHLLEAESHIRSAIKSAATNETPMTVQHLSKLLVDIEHCRKFEKIMDMLEGRKPGSSGSFGSMFDS